MLATPRLQVKGVDSTYWMVILGEMLYKCHNATCPDRKPAASNGAPTCYTCGRAMEMTGERVIPSAGAVRLVDSFHQAVTKRPPEDADVTRADLRQAVKPIDFHPWPHVPQFKSPAMVEPKDYSEHFTARISSKDEELLPDVYMSLRDEIDDNAVGYPQLPRFTVPEIRNVIASYGGTNIRVECPEAGHVIAHATFSAARREGAEAAYDLLDRSRPAGVNFQLVVDWTC